jgi:uncharacterized membrane protein
MPKNRIIIALGVLIALMPHLGFPNRFESFFMTVAGLSIVGLSLLISFDKRFSQKAKARVRKAHKRMTEEKRVDQETTIENPVFNSNYDTVSDDQNILEPKQIA